jgi:hypothetical protein
MPPGYLMVVGKWQTVDMAKDPSPSHSWKVLKPAEAFCRECVPGPKSKSATAAPVQSHPAAPSASRSEASKRAWETIRANRLAKGACCSAGVLRSSARTKP